MTLGVNVDPIGVGAMNGVVVNGGDVSMSASSSAKSLQRTASGHVVNTVLGLPKLKTGRPGGGPRRRGRRRGEIEAAEIRRRGDGRSGTWTRRGSR